MPTILSFKFKFNWRARHNNLLINMQTIPTQLDGPCMCECMCMCICMCIAHPRPVVFLRRMSHLIKAVCFSTIMHESLKSQDDITRSHTRVPRVQTNADGQVMPIRHYSGEGYCRSDAMLKNEVVMPCPLASQRELNFSFALLLSARRSVAQVASYEELNSVNNVRPLVK